ncbi:hypothetical protein MKW92_052414 [Papaver armeniacum]|nr:hypothetical protein MKW92_052414 [Papaver armeniacum]
MFDSNRISIRGTTGISFITNSNTEPLLHKTEKHSDGRREKESPYSNATLLQLITFSWLTPLFKSGYKKALEQDDIPDIDIKDSAEFLSHLFSDSLRQVKERDHSTNNPSIYMAIFLLIRKKAAVNAVFAVVNAGASYVGPYLINDFVAFLSQQKNYSVKTGYIIAFAFLSAKMVEVIAQRQWIFGARQLAGKVLSALATFRMLQDPIFTLTDSLSAIVQARVSVDRVASYLQEDEIQENAVIFVPKETSEEVAIEIENGRFSWDPESSTPTLHGVQLKVMRGMKVAICGTVGSGKSSLLSCIIGEIPKICGTVKECLMGILKDKTILYVTHQVEFLPSADGILMMQQGNIIQAGRFDELLKQNIGFELLVGAHTEALESINNVENSSEKAMSNLVETEIDSTTTITHILTGRHDSEQDLSLEIISKAAGRLTQEEERETGSIGKDVYWSYLTLVWGGALVPLIILSQTSFQVLQIASNYWMAWASPITTDSKPVVDMKSMFLVYIALSVGSAFCALARTYLVAMDGVLTSQKLFVNMLHSVLRAPMSFFDSTPTGRILNRASTDQSVLDLELPTKVGSCAFSIIQILGTIAVMSQVAWQVFVIFIPVMGICIWYQQYYTPTARELARLSGIQKAPYLHHFAESLAGAATIRAYDQEDRFMQTNLGLIDNESRPWFHNVSAMEWLSFRLNILSNLVFASSLVVLVSLPEGVINPSIAGLAVTYGLNLNVLQASVIWNFVQCRK